ncbi:Druantia anti-phage system protein DruA, partial [Candidatus Methylomirabilis limnetica]|uniref:Druantia anti-phage system protein DruA n=1 Tax=Candidatus Methylomirabilis limnetica TaxID=2033718 RepID=UPI000EF1B326
MEQSMTVNVQQIRQLLTATPDWHRTRLSLEICRLWNWQSPTGQYKDMACRSLLLKLERAGSIVLPPRQGKLTFTSRPSYPSVPYRKEGISDSLKALIPLRITVVSLKSEDYALFNCLLSQYHYLGYRGAVGENIKYLIRDASHRPLSCLLFGHPTERQSHCRNLHRLPWRSRDPTSCRSRLWRLQAERRRHLQA